MVRRREFGSCVFVNEGDGSVDVWKRRKVLGLLSVEEIKFKHMNKGKTMWTKSLGTTEV